MGWPVFTASTAARSADIAIELSPGNASTCELALRISGEHAARWVDRALGGNGDSGLAARSGSLSEGECGVLAYLASRVCRELASFQVLDVRPAPKIDACVLWPITLESALGPVALTAALAPGLAESLLVPHRLTVSVFDRAPSALHAGEVWISDRWNLSSASDGLAGEVQLSVEGCTSPLSAIVSAGQLRAQGPSSTRDDIELVLAQEPTQFAQLARIAAGERAPFALADTVELRRESQAIARGELISWRGAIGVRISEA
ncbi:MAG: hypothetical protein ABW352_00485 [Polyangiales bacterium]